MAAPLGNPVPFVASRGTAATTVLVVLALLAGSGATPLDRARVAPTDTTTPGHSVDLRGSSTASPTKTRGAGAPFPPTRDGAALSASSSRWFNLSPSLTPSPAARYAAMFAFDSTDGYAVLFGGANASGVGFADTWAYARGNWTQLFPVASPPPRIGALFVYDPVDRYLVLYGGIGLPAYGVRSDTWTFANGVWTNITSSVAPAARVEPGAAWDPSTQSIVMFGGTNTSQIFGDTWRFVGGTWTELFPSAGPTGRAAPSMTYDSADGYVVMFGGVTFTSNLAETWRFTNGTWTQLTPSTAPSGRATFAMTYDPALSEVVLFGGGVGNDSQFFGDTWTFRGGGWTQQFPLASPTARQFALMAWDPVDGYLLLTSGATNPSGLTLSSDTWVYAGPLGTTIAGPTGPVDVGQLAWFHATVTGGVGPYTLRWDFGNGLLLPGASVSHSFLLAGTASANVSVTDRFGQSANATLALTIEARPTVELSADPRSTSVGATVNLTASARGGSPPLSYAWGLGDGRTRNGPGPFLVNYSRAGAYEINVTVTDAALVNASASVTLIVTSAPSTPAGTPLGLSPTGWVLVVVVIAGAVGVGVFLMRRKPRSPPAGPVAARRSAGGSPAPPGPPGPAP